MPDKPRNQFERKCKVCDMYGVPTADGRILHYGRIAPCRENVTVEGEFGGAQVVADGVEAATSTIHTPDIVQGTYGESGRDYKTGGPNGEQMEAYWETLARSPKPFA